MSADEFDESGKIATDDGLQSLFASPAYQKWLMGNHARMAMAEARILLVRPPKETACAHSVLPTGVT